MSQLSRLIPTSGPGSGTVTSISAGTGITLTPNPITTTGIVALTVPVVIANGGTNATSFANTDGVVYFDGTRLVDTAVGTATFVLTSNGPGLAPTFQPVSSAGGVMTLTGNTGGAISPVLGNINVVGDGTTITIAGSGNTLTVSTTGAIADTFNADSGSAIPLAGIIVMAGGNNITTSAAGHTVTYNVSGTTNHAVQIGNSTGSLTSIAVGTTGQVLTGVTGADPVFAAPAASSITITGDSGGGLTGNSFTFTGDTTGLTFAGAGTTETLGGTLVVAHGGTGETSFTAFAPITGGTTSTGALQSAATGISTAGFVLTSTGASSLPTFQAPATSGTVTSISAGTGITLTPNPITSTGTVALTVPVVVSSGGTGATTLTGVLIGNGTSAVTGNAVTQHDVLIGGASNAITSVAPSATSGVPLISQGASADPAFGTAVVAGGGTGDTSFTAYSVITGGTTSTGALQNVSGVGTLGQVLTSQGAGALPQWATAGTSPVSSSQVVLTSSQVKNLHGTPITIVASPGAGSWINVFQVSAKLTYGGTTPFVAAAGQKLSLFYNNGSGQEIDSTVMPNATITASSNQISNIFGIDNFNVAATAVENKAVVVLNPVATEISGDALNDSTITINVLYQTLTM